MLGFMRWHWIGIMLRSRRICQNQELEVPVLLEIEAPQRISGFRPFHLLCP